jgi:hypothetical protein
MSEIAAKGSLLIIKPADGSSNADVLGLSLRTLRVSQSFNASVYGYYFLCGSLSNARCHEQSFELVFEAQEIADGRTQA